MPTLAEIDRLRACPAPAYPQYHELREAARVGGPLIDPRELPRMQAAIARRGHEWCTAVLGFWMPPTGLRGITVQEARMLVLADGRGLDPPEPAPVAAARTRDQADADARRAAADQVHHRDRQRWRRTLAACAVPVEVRPNPRGRRAGGRDALRHVVPLRDAESGPPARRRRHLAGRALCETPHRAKPMRLAAPTDQPATCQRCLRFAPLIEPAAARADAAAPPPSRQRSRLINDQAERTGHVIRAGRKALTVDDVASAHGFVSLRAAKRAGLFDNPTLPKPINQRGGEKRGNKLLYDAAQIHAHAAGDPIPDLPADDHPDDLLDLREAAAFWGISHITFQSYLNNKPHLIPEPVQVGGVLHWRRGDLAAFVRPGRGSGGGRAAGTTDSAPRRRRGEVQLHILDVLAEGPRNGYQIAEAIAERTGGPKPTNLHLALRKLQDIGLVDSEKVGRARIYELTEAGRSKPAWESLPGEARRARVEALLETALSEDREITAQEVADDLGVHPDHARRLIEEIRMDRVVEMVAAAARDRRRKVTATKVAAEVGVDLDQARRLIEAAQP